MSYKTLRSFVDPLTGKPYRKGVKYDCTDKKHIEKLAEFGLIEPLEETSDREPAPKRTRKRGASDGDS
ncbi:hypothetical protein P4V33_01630 [Brevibacillus borstelensis]|uniref:hypothetical protein n=1 Tax=Brevibacillus borstelensis TaxID=45462 RepID=UPI002E210CA9|nr:hypothetical protein [Brevibacillus borstelensis]